jgi:hypothetical protein
MNYYDELSPSGNNAWAVFEFTQTTPSLWVYLQYYNYSFNSGLSPTSAPANPTYPQSAVGPTGNDDGVFVSCAFRKDGTSPWNGTATANGSDTKSTLVWNSGSVIFPRASGYGGNREAAADGVMRLNPDIGSMRAAQGVSSTTFSDVPTASYDRNSGIYHVIASESSLLFLMDPRGLGNYSCIFYVGKYDPIRTAFSESLEWANYVCLQIYNPDSSNARPILPRFGETSVDFGPRAISSIPFPASGTSSGPDNGQFGTWIGGGANNVFTNRVESVIIDRNFLLEDTNLETPIYLRHPNRAISDPAGLTPGIFDLFTIPIACYGDHFGYGKLGEISDFRFVFGLPTNATINNKRWAVLGECGLGRVKIAIPWDGVTDPGTAGGRTGIIW